MACDGRTPGIFFLGRPEILNIDISRSFEGSFAHQAGKTFNELPFNITNIEQYEQFTTKCSAYYFDKAIARILSEKVI